MISKVKSKFIKSLQIKKYRKQEQCFLVEGSKSVQELMASDFEVVMLLATPDFLASMDELPPNHGELVNATPQELHGLGEFQSNATTIAIAKMKPNDPVTISNDEFALVLDDIRDPGNLGTIIRTADWFGINKIIASPETSDVYNPKVISATMGSFTRVSIFYSDLDEYLSRSTLATYGAFLDGSDVHQLSFQKGGLIVIGNESHGISDLIAKHIQVRITIPRYGRAESLNAAMATGIILDNLRRSV